MLRDALSPGGAFGAMAEYKQFILWRAVPGFNKDGSPKTDKVPTSPRTGGAYAHLTPSNWLTAQEAFESSERTGYGVGFVFTDNDPFFFIDTDKAFDGVQWNAQTTDIWNIVTGVASEYSQSNTGMHFFGKYTGEIKHSCKNIDLGMELYTSGRFVALTGNGAQGDSGVDATSQLVAVVDKYFVPKVTVQMNWTTEAVEGWFGITDDNEVIRRALKSNSVKGQLSGKESFKDLWNGGGGEDLSSNDMALAQHLAFWTGNNCERIRSIMLQSGLVRDKWTDREDYLRRSITNACAMQTEWHGMTVPLAEVKSVDMSSSFEPEFASGVRIMSPTAQVQQHFKDCIYLSALDKALVPSGELLKPAVFKAIYGGWEFTVDGNGKTSKDAWEVFTQSRAVNFPKAHMTCFKPDLPFGAKVEKDSRTLINAYRALDIPMEDGDVTPFLSHMEKIFPDPDDREILFSYMASVIKYKGEKFQWAPLIQGTPGNGKTVLSRVIEYTVGSKYTHSPNAGEIGEKYNGWLLNKVFINVEDIKVSESKAHIMETLKPMITNDKIEIRLMGVDKTTEEICCNFIFNSNHKDAVQRASGERRFAIFYCPQQTTEDLRRDGMDGDYFPNLYRWLNDVGYKRVAHYLTNYKIPLKYNPAVRTVIGAKAHRAPHTSSEAEVGQVMLGFNEEITLNAIQDCLIGFRGGFVSSAHLDKLFAGRVRVGKFKDIMGILGYTQHPNLTGGRSSRNVSCDDNKRSVLYVLKSRADLMLIERSKVVDEYINAQSEE